MNKKTFLDLTKKTDERYVAKLEEYVARPDADVLIKGLYELEIRDLKEKMEVKKHES